MFILVLFGYKQSKIFAIDCLTATLIDSIWFTALKEINSNFKSKEDVLSKEKIALVKKISRHEARLEQIDKQIKADEEKGGESIMLDKKKVFS